MGIPGNFMPGGGGPMGPGPMGMPGAGAPMPPGEAPGGPVDDIMKLLASFQEEPAPAGEDKMLIEASLMINAAYARIAPRSARAAKFLATANQNIQSARETLKDEPTRTMSPAPSLGMPETAGMNPGAM